MRPLNVLFVMMQMSMGGSERLVHTLVSRLDRSRFNPAVAWFYGHEPLDEFKELQVPLHFVPVTKRVDVSAINALGNVIEQNAIRVVNAQHFMPTVYSYYGCKVRGNAGLIFTAHSRWETEMAPWRWRLAGNQLLRRIDRSVGVSPDVERALQEVFRLADCRTLTIENGVDIANLDKNVDVNKLRRELGLARDDVVIGVVANLKVVKNHVFLLEAFARLAAEFAQVKLMLVGRGFAGEPDDTESALCDFVKIHGLNERVLFAGYRSNVGELLHVFDMFCLPSLREGLPISLIEAMGARVPVVGTNVEGIRDVITPGVDGILVELGDVDALLNALRGLVADRDLRHRLGSAAHRTATQNYSLQRCVSRYENLFLSVAERTRS